MVGGGHRLLLGIHNLQKTHEGGQTVPSNLHQETRLLLLRGDLPRPDSTPKEHAPIGDTCRGNSDHRSSNGWRRRHWTGPRTNTRRAEAHGADNKKRIERTTTERSHHHIRERSGLNRNEKQHKRAPTDSTEHMFGPLHSLVASEHRIPETGEKRTMHQGTHRRLADRRGGGKDPPRQPTVSLQRKHNGSDRLQNVLRGERILADSGRKPKGTTHRDGISREDGQ